MNDAEPSSIKKIFPKNNKTKNGDNGTRTRNRMLAKHVFYQLKYIPGEIILNYIKKINRIL